MDKKDVKRGYELAKQELKDRQIEKVKEIVKATLEKLESLKEKKKDIEEQIKILKLDLDDLKQGRLDRIEERQSKDKRARETSIFQIIKIVEEHHHYDHWYQPYKIVYTPCDYYWSGPTIDLSTTPVGDNNFTITGNSDSYTINCSVAKDYAAGTYEIDGRIINFR